MKYIYKEILMAVAMILYWVAVRSEQILIYIQDYIERLYNNDNKGDTKTHK